MTDEERAARAVENAETSIKVSHGLLQLLQLHVRDVGLDPVAGRFLCLLRAELSNINVAPVDCGPR